MPVVKSAAQEHLDKIGVLLTRLQKRAKEESDPGGYDGDTSHATKNTDNGTVDPTEGARSQENEQDIKHDQPAGVDGAVEGTPGGQESAQLNIGTQQSGPDEGSGGNIPSVEDKLDDPGGYEGDTSHPADLDNPAVGEKYGAARRLRSSILQVKEAGTELLAKIVMANDKPAAKRAADSVLPAETPGPASGSEDASPSGGGGGEGDSEKKEEDKEAGAKSADEAIKKAQAQAVINGIADTLKSASYNASITADYLDGFFAQAGKGAGDDGDSDDKGGDSDKGESSSSDSDSDDTGSSPPSQEGGEPDGDEAGGGDLMSLLQGGGGGDAGGGMPSSDIGGGGAASEMLGDPAAGGGGDPLAALGGGAPPMGGGAPPMGGPPMGGAPGADPAMAGGAGGDQQLAMLAEALAQAGITPEQLQAATLAKGAAKLPPKGLKAGSWAPRTAKEAEQFRRMQEVISELVS